MAKGRPSKRKNKGKKTKKNREKLYLTRTDFTTGKVTTSFYPPEAFDDMQAYIGAHRLIPWNYEFGSPGSFEMVRKAVALLASGSSSSSDVLASLAILGHSPCPEAFAALSEYADSDRPHAGVASFALDECLGLSEAWCA